MANQLVDQGVLNRLKASIIFTAAPQLNISVPYLGKQAIQLALEGDVTTGIPTQTGVVQSPEPYQMARLRINLLKTQFLADLYKARMETNSLLGECIVRPDVSYGGISPYPFYNCAINGVADQDYGGTDPGFNITISGIYYLNSALWT